MCRPDLLREPFTEETGRLTSKLVTMLGPNRVRCGCVGLRDCNKIMPNDFVFIFSYVRVYCVRSLAVLCEVFRKENNFYADPLIELNVKCLPDLTEPRSVEAKIISSIWQTPFLAWMINRCVFDEFFFFHFIFILLIETFPMRARAQKISLWCELFCSRWIREFEIECSWWPWTWTKRRTCWLNKIELLHKV